MFRPVIPLSGVAGWNFLQKTYDRQLETFSKSAQIRNDRDYLVEKLSSPLSKEDFLDDRRLLRVALTAFGLEGEEWKRGFIDKVLTEVADPESTFLARLNNPKYTAFAEAFIPLNDKIYIGSEALDKMTENYTAEAFEIAVGEVDEDLRLSMNYASEIGDLIGENSSDKAVLYRILGSVPVRNVLQTALGLPQDTVKLDLDKQADIFKEKLSSKLGINSLADLTKPENIEKVVHRYQVLQLAQNGPSATTPGYTALTLLSGIGSGASQNLFLSNLL